jgi:hypothetical protein
MSTRLVTCVPLDLHTEVAVSELLWSFFASFVDGCSQWKLPNSSSSVSNETLSAGFDIGSALTVEPRSISSAFFGEVSQGQFQCTPPCCKTCSASHVSAVLAQQPNLGLAYDMFCSAVIETGKIRKYSASLYASISIAAKIFFHLLAAEQKQDT